MPESKHFCDHQSGVEKLIWNSKARLVAARLEFASLKKLPSLYNFAEHSEQCFFFV